ncbi:MAG: iron ABC transporter substrate-binding protein [Parvibaculaceae bacterium]
MENIHRRQFLKAGALAAGALAAGRFGMGAASAAGDATLTLYNGQHAHTTAALVDVFTKTTGVKVNIRKGSSSQLANQIIEEGDASPADVFYSEESPPVAALAERGLLSKLADDTLKQVPEAYVARDGTWTGASMRSRVVAYNKALVKESEFPDSVLDFATEAWKDRIAYVPTSGAFQEQIVAIEQLKGRDAALGWLKGLKAYGRSYNGNGAAMKAVEAGEIPAALINNYYWFNVAKEVGDANMKSALFYFGHKDPGALITVSAAGILKSSKKQGTAQKFLAFMVSAAGQEAIAGSVAEYPVRAGVTSPYALKPFGELDPPDVTPADLGDASDALVLEREAGLV